MNKANASTVTIFIILRWVIRIVGSLLILFLIYMLAGHIISPEESSPGVLMILIISLWTAGVGLAWKWEGIGGLVILISSIFFFALRPDLIWPPMLYHIFPLIAILFLLCWLKLRDL